MRAAFWCNQVIPSDITSGGLECSPKSDACVMKFSWKEIFMTKKRKRGKPEQIVKLPQEGQVMLAAGKSEAEVVAAA